MKRHTPPGTIGYGSTTPKFKKHTQPKRRSPRKRKRRGRSTKYHAKSPAQIFIKDGIITMRLPRRLKSYNQRGGHWAEYSDRQGWKSLLAGAEVTTDGSVVLPVTTRMRLDLIRLAPSKRYLLDVDNLSVSGKRLTDSLVEAGYLIDDDRTSLDGAYTTQGLSRDKKYWTLVQLKEAAAYVDNVQTVDPMLWNLRDIQKVYELVDPIGGVAVESADEPETSTGPRRRRALLRRSPGRRPRLPRAAERGVLRLRTPQLGHGQQHPFTAGPVASGGGANKRGATNRRAER